MGNEISVGPSFALNLNSSKTLPLAIVNKSGQALSWQAVWAADNGGPNWLSLDRTGGTLVISEVQTIYATANSAQVVGAPGNFSGNLTFTPTVGGNAQPPEVLTIELHVSPGVYTDNGPKAPGLSQGRFDFNAQLGILGPSQLQVTSNPNEPNIVNWTMTSMVNWLRVNPNNGIFQGGGVGGPQNVNVIVQNAPATKGTYTTDLILTLTFNNAAMAAAHEPTSILVPISLVV